MEKAEALTYLQGICAKREYCRSEIVRKAQKALDGDGEAAQELADALAEDGFVDDARYARAFARDKSALTGWGPEKIRYALMMKGITKSDIARALDEIDRDAASSKMEKILYAKYKSLQGDPYIKFKLIKYALSRGYEYDTVSAAVEELLREES